MPRVRALATEATGFVGSHICERLAAAGNRVCGFARPSGDVANLSRTGADEVMSRVEDEPTPIGEQKVAQFRTLLEGEVDDDEEG